MTTEALTALAPAIDGDTVRRLLTDEASSPASTIVWLPLIDLTEVAHGLTRAQLDSADIVPVIEHDEAARYVKANGGSYALAAVAMTTALRQRAERGLL